jgi:putative endonuclease
MVNKQIESQTTKQVGNAGEEQTVTYLKSQGFTIVARNYAKRYGEIDIIAQKKDVLAFVEVKFRTKQFFDTTEVITRSKQRKIIMVAKEFICSHTVENKVCRFDVALIEKETNSLCYIPNAFTESEE